MTNYRPISLLPSLSKVLEVFRKGTNIENAVFTLTDIILTSLNHRQQIVGIFCDLSEAFECINLVIIYVHNIWEKNVLQIGKQ
jgi:hypothetical protein